MKEQLQKFRLLHHGKLLLLAMIMFIGQGVVFSQGIKTVTTNGDAGAGSLRQAIADAVDGDVIKFDGAITTITVDSTLDLGDKTLTIDGAGDVILQRDLLSLDSFRVVTIIGDTDKVVTIKNLTIQNGFSKEHGGGLYADNSTGGQTVLDNLTFNNNQAINNGGGAYTEGLLEYGNIVTNCVFTKNIAWHTTLGRGGALFPKNSTITNCTFTENECGDSGGAIFCDSNVEIKDSQFNGNKAVDDAGGAIRMQGRDSYIRNCRFESNSSNSSGGAIMFAHGAAYDCQFFNNFSAGIGGAINANNDIQIYNCLFDGNSTNDVGGGVYIDDNTLLSNCIVINNTASDNGGGVYVKGAKGDGIVVGCVIANNKADTLGGGLYLEKAKVINSTITNNYAGENGGAFTGDGAWFVANSIVYNNDAAGADKNMQIISNSATDQATNCAIDANAYDAGAWTANNITTLDASPFVGGSDADSLMLPVGSPLIDIGDTTGLSAFIPETDLNGVKRVINGAIDLGPYERYISLVVTTDADNGAGSLRQAIADAKDGESLITFADGITTIKVDTTLVLGDKTLIIDGGGVVVLDGAFNGDAALDTLGVISITGVSEKVVTIKNLTIQNGSAKNDNGGGLSADHSAGGKTVLENISINNNTGLRYGGGIYLIGSAGNPSEVTNCEFTGNYVDNGSGEGDGGGMYVEFAKVSGCTFTNNEAKDDAGALYANDEVEIISSTFTGNKGGDAGGAIRTGTETVTITDCSFDSNSTTAGPGGAVFLARGSVINCEFVNNSAATTGGAISSNNNECVIDYSTFHGNSADMGGAIYVDDGGMLTNCIIENNTATSNGGGLYLNGAKAAPAIVGCVIANNTADAQGGGLYILSANVINCTITENYAGTNGGAFTGTTGPWFLGNSIVYINDAAGADKNIEFVSNSATTHAAYDAIDATAYNDTWTATNVVMLNKSPFVGGTGVDSLHSASSAVVDAGTLDYGIADVLPKYDLDGNYRIQGTIDMGAYETEIISVLGVSLDRASLEVSVGGTGTLVATIEPDFATDKSVTWSSSDEGVATVVDGVVTGVASGTATITVTTVDGGFTATCDVTVNIAVTGVSLNEEAITLEVDQTFTLVATVTPADATNPTVGWVSGNEDVATVDNNGLVTAVSEGTATISVVTLDGSFIAACEVTVTPAKVAVTGVSLDQTTLTLAPDETATLAATVAPNDATDQTVTWTSSDAAVATVADGVVTAVAEGTCTITVTTTDGGFTATCDVTVQSTGINNIKAAFRVYPNPVQDILVLEGKNIRSVAIYSITGRPLMIVKEGFKDGINMATFESGMYFLKVTTDEGTAVKTIVKE